MPETLLSTSNVLIFGRIVEDLTFQPAEAAPAVAADVQAATVRHMAELGGLDPGGDVELAAGEHILVVAQQDSSQNGIYAVGADNGNSWGRAPQQPPPGSVVRVVSGSMKGLWRRKRGPDDRFEFFKVGRRKRRELGSNSFLSKQLKDMLIARIYGFSYEGTYYDLPRPVLFGVHGEGDPAVLMSNIEGAARTNAQLTRAPQEPSISGVAAADFGFADDIRVWSYDKADYTIRMDVETGMFEQVLLDAYFADGGHVSGMKVGGPRVSGMKVSGMKVSGMKVGGPRGGRGDPTD
jgi:hypothetical protein